ncbi:KH domain-containing protein [Nodosilinea sp. P-1105]|uniref:KH domain-containing protein n=1 Tax=Nodosilinea sp. P-1105 TaxID=2546229 RepID=UPI001469E188|nr:KH domain-containing protein [Nodosilinea sp. P-1105]NMF84401.1 KH domain-containing protein [Nodosilinea sp. P-1105]
MDRPDFSGLVQFLVEPFLDSPDSLRIDCEENSAQSKVWIRIAFDGDERGRVFGRGGRNIQAIRTVVRATATLAGWSAHFDVYGAAEQGGGDGAEKSRAPRRADQPGSKHHRPKPRPRPKSS